MRQHAKRLHRNPIKAYLIHERLKLMAYNHPLYLAAVDAYDLLTSTGKIRPLTNTEHERVIHALSNALLSIEE